MGASPILDLYTYICYYSTKSRPGTPSSETESCRFWKCCFFMKNGNEEDRVYLSEIVVIMLSLMILLILGSTVIPYGIKWWQKLDHSHIRTNHSHYTEPRYHRPSVPRPYDHRDSRKYR
jgi:hypothetical protein